MYRTRRTIPSSYDDAIRTLVGWHRGLGGRGFRAYAFPDPSREVVRLVEVSSEVQDTGDLLPVTFGASEQFPFRSTVAMATPRQWAQVMAGDLQLPEGWDSREMRQVYPE